MIKAIIFDFGYTIWDPDTKEMVPESVETLEKLQGKYKMSLMSRTGDLEARKQQIKDFDLEKYFDLIEVINKEDRKDFEPIIEKLGVSPSEILVVGDRQTSEIAQGKKLGMKTGQILNGPEKARLPENEFEKPDFQISHFKEIYEYLN